MGQDLISIIIPVYNVENYIENCVSSVIKQTYKNIEIILVDDGSMDKSGIICDELAKRDNRIKVIHQKNKKAAEARNCGINNSNGRYIIFIDSDDYVDEEYVLYLYNLIKKNDSKLGISPYTVISNNKKNDIGKNFSQTILTVEEALRRLVKEEGFTVSPCAKIYDKSLFDNIRYPSGKLFEDNATTYKLIMKCEENIIYGNESHYFYNIRDNSSMTSEFNLDKLQLIEWTDIMYKDVSEKYPNLVNCLKKKMITVRFSILRMIKYEEKSEEILTKRNEIEKYIKNRKYEILKNEEIDKRDKIALITLLMGRGVFHLSWNVYKKIKY